MEQKLKITNDLVFQRMFGKPGNENITKGFLEKILGIQIESLTLDTNKRLIGNVVENKIGRVDVKAKLNDGTKVIIEMQVAPYKAMTRRFLYYWAETYVGDLKKGEPYEKLDKTIGILISVESIEETKNIEEYHTKWTIREEENLSEKLTNDLEMHIIELSKFKEGQNKPEENWIKFINGGEIEDMVIDDKYLEEAKKELKYLCSDPVLREEYDERIRDLRDIVTVMEDKFQEGMEKGMERGKEEGINKTKKNVILNMSKNKMKIEDICIAVDMQKEEVEEIIKNSSK